MLISATTRLVRYFFKNHLWVRIFPSLLFTSMLLFCGQVNAASTLTISTPTPDGRFTVTWNGSQTLVQFREGFIAPGSSIVWSAPQEKPPTGSIAFHKTQPGIYVFTITDCYRDRGVLMCLPGAAGRDVVIGVAPPTVTATFSPVTISEGGTATLTWNSTNATNCNATGITGVSGTSGSVTYNAPTVMSANQTVTIPVTCFNGGTNTTANAAVTVQWVNDTPTVGAIANRTINEDTGTGAIAFTVADEETPPGSLVVTATSSNTSVIPNGNLVLGGSGVNRTIVVTPAANAFGSATITVKVTDAHNASAQSTFTVTVNPVNDAPTISAISNIAIDENQDTGARSFSVGDAETAAGSLSITATSSNTALVPNNNIILGGSGSSRTFKVTPLSNKSGSAVITLTVSDGVLTASRSFTVTVNNLPIRFDSATESTTDGVINMSWSKASGFVQLSERLGINGTWTLLRDNAPAAGSHTITKTQNGTYYYRVLDCYYAGGPPNGNLTCTDGDVRIVTVALPPPTANASIAPATINEGGTATLTWNSTNATNCNATGITGVSGTSGSVTYNAPTVMSANQTVTIPVTCFNGAATTTVNATVAVQWVNDTPTISTIAAQTINEDSSTNPLAFTVADEETAPATLQVTASSSNTALIPNSNLVFVGSGANRAIKVTPAADAFGSATITVKVTDAHNASAQSTFTVTVNPVNDAPSISDIANVTIDEGVASTGNLSFSVGDLETAASSLSVSVSANSNTTLVPNANIALGGSGANRTVNITPAANRHGSTTITVEVSDGQLTASRSFVVAVNDLPVAFTSIPASSNNGVVAMSWSNAREFVRLRVRDDAGNWTTLLEQGGPAGSYTDTRAQNGNYLYQVLDCYHAGGPPNGNPTCTTADVRTVVVSFPVPVITASFNPATINESPASAANTSTLTWSATNAQTCSATGIAGVNGTSGSVVYTAPSVMSSNQQLNVVITCIGQGPSTATKTASLAVNAINDAPTISTIPEQFIQEDQSTPVLSFTMSDEETPAGSLVVTAVTDNDALVSPANIQLGGSGTTRTIRVTPKPNAYGSANITVRVSDGQITVPTTFRVSVASVNDLPTISPIPDQRIGAGASTSTLNFTVGDIETPAASLSVTASSDKPGLVAPGGIILGGSGASRTVKITPVAAQSGLGTVTIKVTDADGGESIQTIKVSVLADTSTAFDMTTAPAAFKYSLTGGVTNLGSGDFVATTQGALSVDGGAASYQVAIDLPPAIRDLAPTLGLSYNSLTSDGVMGVGWSLGGLSSIHRCRTTFATEGAEAQKSNPHYTQGDRLCLDGRKLVIAGSTTPANDSTYWAANATYQTEVDNFTRIQAHGAHQGAHEYFTLTTKDGRTLSFGRETSSQNSRIYAPGQPNGPASSWELDKVEDRYGNSYQVHYLRDTAKGEHYPSHITWEPESAVVFSYIGRTGNTPWGYDGGHPYERTKLLDKVTTYIGVTNSSSPTAGTKVKEYDIDYQLSTVTNRHLVKEIRECGFDETAARQCAKPLRFDWQEGELGFEQTPTPLQLTDGRRLTALEISQFEDVDGDGYVDIVGRFTVTAWGSPSGLFIPSGFSTPTGIQALYMINTRHGKRGIMLQKRMVQAQTHHDVYLVHFNRGTGTVTTSLIATMQGNDGAVIPGDFNNDGLSDFAFNAHIWLQDNQSGSTKFTKSLSSGKTVGGIETAIIDFNHDGLADFTYVHPKERYQVNQVNRFYGHANQKTHFDMSGSVSHYANPVLQVSPPSAPDYWLSPAAGMYRTLVDLNGDGIQDYLYQHFVFSTTMNPGQVPDNWYVSFGTGNAQPWQHYTEPENTGLIVAPIRNSRADNFIFSTQYSFNYDYDKDGVEDIILLKGTPVDLPYRWRVFKAGYQLGQLQLTDTGVDPFFGRGDYLIEQPVAGLMDNMFRGDINNDGLADIIFSSSGQTSSGFTYLAAKQQQPDLLRKVTDGFGATQELTYSPLVDDDNNGKPLYTPDAVVPTFPQAPADRGLQVVKQLSVSNGIGGKVHTYFNYTGGKQDLQGRGFLGFARIETTSTSSGVETRTDYRQDYPHIGRVKETLVKDGVSGNLISHTENQYAIHSSNGRFPYLESSIQQDYQLLTNSQNNPLGVSKLQNSFDACGNLVSRTTTVGAGLSGSQVTGVLNMTTLVNTIPNGGNADCSDDFVTEAVVTVTDGLESRSVTTTFQPNAQFDVYEQTAFTGTAIAVTTTTNRNDDGVVTGSSNVASDLGGVTTVARTSQFTDFEKGIYPATLTNAKGHSAMVAYDYRFGKVNQQADANGLVSGRVYDVLGRNVQETAADGTVTELLSYYCATAPVNCPGNAVYLVATRISNAAEPGKLGAPLSIAYYDQLQRVIRTEVYSLDQTTVKVDTDYNAKGQLLRVSEPYTAVSAHYTTYSNYDALNRPDTVTGPDGGSMTRSYARAGSLLKTIEAVTVITPNGNLTQLTNRYTNALGQVTRVEDAEGTPVDYTYDAQGNLKTTIVNNNSLTTITVIHDVAGNKTQITDPDAGVIGFAYNGFGELRRQTWQPNLSGHTKSITYTYDVLGRKTGRTDQPASGSATTYTWSWDAPNQLGLLASQSGNGFTETYGYDHLTRLQTQTTQMSGLSGSRVFTHSYDNFSRPTNTIYPNGLSIARDYQAAGVHVRTRDITSGTNKTLWVLGNAANDRGQLTRVLYGNGVVTEHTYEQNNGRLARITSGRLTPNNTVNNLKGDIQSLSYSFDSLGNLYNRTTQRSDNNGLGFENTTESFAYDLLNRVTTSATNGLFSRFKDYEYDALGNLIARTDLGTLAYNRNNNAGVHAVTSSGTSGAPDFRVYQYDKYGNMTQRGGESITYDVFNKPLTMSSTNGTTSFSYGPNHERFKQVSGNKTTYVFNGGTYEEIIENGAVTQKSYVDGFLVQTKTGSTTEVIYLHKDHLGSTEAMTDSNGNLINRMSFGVWGERQQADWQSGIPATAELNAFKTTQGYTGHEQLDAHNLIHMGGRVYDPTLGRFLSADLFIQSPYDTQSFNRYSYVFNNPLSRIDPTGYFSDLMQWAMESAYQHSASWHWNASYQASQSHIKSFQAKKAAERQAKQNQQQHKGGTVLIEELPDNKKEESRSEREQKSGNGTSLGDAQKGNGVIGYDDDGVPIFDESHPRFHSYYGSNSCLKTSSGCTYANGEGGLLRFPAPGASGKPIVDEQTGFAIPVGTVRHEVYDGGAQVINVTLEGKHILHPGIVRRWVTQDALSVTIHTYGEGTGPLPGPNEFFSESLWRRVDNNIFDYMSQQ